MPAAHKRLVAVERVCDDVRRFGPEAQLVGSRSRAIDRVATSVVIPDGSRRTDANHTFTEPGAQAELTAIVIKPISARFR